MSTLGAGELLDALASAMGWPRTRPARLTSGSRASVVTHASLCVTDAALDELDASDAGGAAVLATPPSAALAARGRRSYELFGDEGGAGSWARTERVVIDASELLAGGNGGFDELLCGLLGATSQRVLAAVDSEGLKFIGFVPADALPTVRAAVFAAGAGAVGDYSECSWSTTGTGTFRGGESTNPSAGAAGEFEQVDEVRFETIVPAHRRDAVCQAFVAAHPYEEPAFDVYELRTPARVGAGRIVELSTTAQAVAAALHQVAGEAIVETDHGGQVTRAVVTSAGASAVLSAVLLESELQLLVCGDATRAEVQLLGERGIAVVRVDRSGIVRALGEKVAGQLSRRTRLPVRMIAPLAFPEAAPPASTTGPYRLYFDGGSRGNPGPAAAAWVLYAPDGTEVARWREVLGVATNNVAEYTGAVSGLHYAVDAGISELQLFGDSELIIKQLRGEYKVKHPDMQRLHAEATSLLGQFASTTTNHVYRTDNAVADALVNEALDAQGSQA